MSEYGEFVISAVEIESGKWQAEIRRRDGKEMRVGATTMAVFKTMNAPTAGEAMKLAKQAIDANTISRSAGWT
jgi:hypothetical protein